MGLQQRWSSPSRKRTREALLHPSRLARPRTIESIQQSGHLDAHTNYYRGLPIFTTEALSNPGFAPGNSLHNIEQLHSPFGPNDNLALAKRFYAGERVNMKLRMEFFNVLNRMQVCTPDDTVPDGANNFGFVQPNGRGGSSPCQGNTPRQGQAYFKISF